MNFKQRICRVQSQIDKLQWEIVEADKNFKYYFIHVPDMCSEPMEVRLYRRPVSNESIMVANLRIHFLDIYIGSDFVDQIESEEKYQLDHDAPTEQIDEIKNIKSLFGV